MVDPLKEPLVSLLLKPKCPVEILPLLKMLPIEDINRSVEVNAVNHPQPQTNSQCSILELFVLRNRGQAQDNKYEGVSIPSQIAIELVNQGAALTNTGTWLNGGSWDILDLALHHSHYGLVEHLLDGPLQHLQSDVVHRKMTDGSSWLQMAVHIENIGFVKKLLSWGADCNEISKHKRTVLYDVRTPEMLSLLLDHGARIDIVELDEYGISLPEQWSKRLVAADVKKLNNMLFKKLKTNADLDLTGIQAGWMDSLLKSPKGVIVDQQKKLKIPADFTWEKDGVTCSPLVWMVLKGHASRNAYQQEKVFAHFAQDPQNMPLCKLDQYDVRNIEALAFFEAVTLQHELKSVGWSNCTIFNEKMVTESNAPMVERLTHLFEGFTRTAIALQSIAFISPMVAKTAFNWYKIVLQSRSDASSNIKLMDHNFQKIIEKVYKNTDLSMTSAIQTALQNIWDGPMMPTLRDCAFIKPIFTENSMVCLFDLAAPLLQGQKGMEQISENNIKNIVSAFANATALQRFSPYMQKTLYNPISDVRVIEHKNFNVFLNNIIAILDGQPFGEFFDDKQWTQMAEVYKSPGRISTTNTNYDMWEKMNALTLRETIRRQVSSGVQVKTQRKL